MSDCSEWREVRGRKAHCCYLCGMRIRKGALHTVTTGIVDGNPYRARFHAVCLHETRGWDDSDWETFTGHHDEFRMHSLGLPLLQWPERKGGA